MSETLETLESLEKHNTIFISAQPDEIYFHWQVEIYLYQFAKHGIQDRCYALFGYRDTPSEYALGLAKKYPHIVMYKDDRDISAPNHYKPTIRPHLLKKFFAEHPDLGASVFYHDSDIFLVQMPRFELMLADDVNYLSDTISYIGYNYITNCQKRYEAKHPDATPLIDVMCNCVGLPVALVKENELNSGGAQYLLKGIDAKFWEEAEDLCQKLADCMKAYDDKYPVDHGVQLWTADMWIVLWLVWKRGNATRIHKDLDFSWAPYTATDYHKKRIFHLAGISQKNCEGHFYKAHYHKKNVFVEYARNKSIFDNVKPTSATYEYVKVLKEYAEGSPVIIKESSRFLLDSKDAWSSIYTKDSATFSDRPLWRSVDAKYFIFNNGTAWVLTGASYEKDLTTKTGGYASTYATEPYEGGWNQPCVIRLLDTGLN